MTTIQHQLDHPTNCDTSARGTSARATSARGTSAPGLLALAASTLAIGLMAGVASAQPFNNFCDSMININATGSVSFTTVSASTDGPSIPGCGAGSIFNDVWFCFTAPSSGLFTVSTCGGTGLDTVLAVYQGCGCLALSSAPLGCNDDSCNTQSRLDFFAVAGQRYSIRLGSYAESAFGAGQMTISGPPTAVGNDVCSGATPVALDVPHAFDLSTATTPGSSEIAPVACTTTGRIFNDRWYAFTAPFAGAFEASTCGQTGADTIIATYNQCPTSTTLAISCDDDSCNLQSAAVFAASAGQTIYVRLGGYSAGERGAGTMLVSSLIVGGPVAGPDGHNYYLLAPMHWTEAAAAAAAMGGYLAEIGSAAESAFVLGNVLNMGGPAASAAWIGLRREPTGVPYPTWTTGNPVTYSRWASGVPAPARATGFVATTAGSGTWFEFDNDTFSTRPYAIVEVEAIVASCVADVASDSLDTNYNPNGALGSEDLDAFITGFIGDNAAIADVASDSTDVTYNPNGFVGPEDLDAFIGSFIAGC